jgi:uncharacterized damage-inducible protein DinB
MKLPAPGTYNSYFDTYISKVAGDPLVALESQLSESKSLLAQIHPAQETFRYAEGKWTIRELVGHMIDTERIMSTRAMCIARGEQQSLPGFDENAYVENAGFNARTLPDLAQEFSFVRSSTIALFRSFSEAALDRSGTANNNPITPRAVLFMIPGHHIHHVNILRERYLGNM